MIFYFLIIVFEIQKYIKGWINKNIQRIELHIDWKISIFTA